MAAIEIGAIYQVYNPGFTQWFTLNDPTDSFFVGYVDEITGLDAPEVRENAQNKTAAMGGYHGAFWAGRRPWTMTGFVMPVMPVSARSASQELMESVLLQCLQKDGLLAWVPSDGWARQLYFRYQQPFRSTKGQSNVNRNFQIAGVAADWRILGGITHSITGTGPLTGTSYSGDPTLSLPTPATNVGDADGPCLFIINGPINAPLIYNATSGKQIWIQNLQLAAGHHVTLDMRVTYPSLILDNTSDITGYVSGLFSDWSIAAVPGDNQWQLVEGAAAQGLANINNSSTSLQVQWLDSWV